VLEGRKKKVRCELGQTPEEKRRSTTGRGHFPRRHDSSKAEGGQEGEKRQVSATATGPPLTANASFRLGSVIHRDKSEKQVDDRGEPERWVVVDA
jgi:hypothetical protein